MKKIILLLIVILTCSFTTSKKESTGLIPQEQIMQKVTYSGHTYIVYQFAKSSSGGNGHIDTDYKGYPKGTIYEIKGGYGGAGIVHDPDCKCQKPQKELIKRLNTLLNDSTFVSKFLNENL